MTREEEIADFREYARTYWDIIPDDELTWSTTRYWHPPTMSIDLNKDRWTLLHYIRERSWRYKVIGHSSYKSNGVQFDTFEEAWPIWEKMIRYPTLAEGVFTMAED